MGKIRFFLGALVAFVAFGAVSFNACAAVDLWLQKQTRSWESLDPEIRAFAEKVSDDILKPKTENLLVDTQVSDLIQNTIDRITQAPLNQELFRDLKIIFYLFKTNHNSMASTSVKESQGELWISGHIILSFRSESEFAAIVAHELGHILARHSLSLYKLGKQNVLQKMKKHWLWRKNEIEADLMAAHLLANAGFDPKAIIAALKRIEVRDTETCPSLLTRLDSLLKRHPLTYDRIREIEKHLQENPHLNQSEQRSETPWQEWKDAMNRHVSSFF